MSTPPPTAWTILPMSRSANDGAVAATTDPMPKSTNPPMYARRRPNRSERRPIVGSVAMTTTR